MFEVKHTPTVGTSHFTPRHFLERNETICSREKLHMNVPSSFICNVQKLEEPQNFHQQKNG